MITKHLAPAIERFYRDRKVMVSPEVQMALTEQIAEHNKQSLEQWSSGEDSEKGRNPVTASSATKCVLSNWFSHNKFPSEPLPGRAAATFRIGHLVEADLYCAAVLAGEEVSHFQHQMKATLGGWTSNAYIDFLHKSSIDGKRRIVDVKTMSSYSYEKIFKRNQKMDDTFGYLGQFSVYAAQGIKDGIVDSPEVLVLCYNKNTGHIGEYLYEAEVSKVEEAHANSALVQKHTEYLPGQAPPFEVDVGKMDANRPPRPKGYEPELMRNGDYKLGLQCSYCPYKFSCWTRPHQRIHIGIGPHENPLPMYDTQEPLDQWVEVEYKSGKPIFVIKRR